ncbi:MAG: DUF6288 domain-containing protein, partial [Planctomycetota bacterium]
MGTFSETAPYNCPKTDAIIQDAKTYVANSLASSGSSFRKNIMALGLLATGESQYWPILKTYAAQELQTEYAIDTVGSGSGDETGKFGSWFWSYRNLFLTEYYLATNDSSVLPAINALCNIIPQGQTKWGTWCHNMCGPDGIPEGYGAMNQAALVCVNSLILGTKCGVTNPLTLDAIEKSRIFFSIYTDRKGVDYGSAAGMDTDNNGKSASCSIFYDLLREKRIATWHAKLALVGYGQREIGHTGNFWSFFYGPLGAARLGQHALTAHFKELIWLFELERRWDGGFIFQGNPGKGGLMGGFGGNHKYAGYDTTGTRLTMFCYPRNAIYLTGKEHTIVDPLSKPRV